MEFVRPEIRQFVWRYSDALVGVAVSFFGIGWALSSVGFMVTLGYSVTIAGALLIFAGIQRGRFKVDPNGVGMVTIDEGQVTYFGPYDGGIFKIDDLTEVDLLTDSTGQRYWTLIANGQEPLTLPLNAIGADALFDVFNGLPGMQTNHLLCAVESATGEHVMIWRRNPSSLH